MKTISIIGTGAIGGYYGMKLAHAGNDVHFLLHSDYDYVKENGLWLESPDGDIRLKEVKAHSSVASMPKSDLVIVALKNTRNALLQDMLPALLHPQSIVLLIQNGIGVEEDVQKMLPNAQLVAGLAFICSTKVGPGQIRHQCYGSINLGNYSCKLDREFQELIATFRNASIETNEVEYYQARWKKAVWNMPFNGMTVALNTRTDLLLQNPSTRRLIEEQMMEVIWAAKALGVKGLDEEFAQKMIDMTLVMEPYSPSMKVDYDHHRPMEIEYLYTRPIEEAKKVGFDMSKLSMLEAELRFLDGNAKKSMKMQDLKYTKGNLLMAVDSFFYHDFLYFWKHEETGDNVTKACLSQWYPSKFRVDGIEYHCAEQYMMAEKARVFHDEETLSEILVAIEPDVIKKLGRKVKNFDPAVWNDKCIEVVYEGNLNKFNQNPKLKDFLLSTGKSTLAEASPFDTIWGIGLKEKDATRLTPHEWKGENRLGFILMEVREKLRTML